MNNDLNNLNPSNNSNLRSRYYFVADAHLGSLLVGDSKEHELKLVRMLDIAKADAKAVFLLGDIFDFWFEYKYVVPKGFTRLLGKLSELCDAGIEVHFFCGNHDVWTFGYLEREVGVIVHRQPLEVDILGKRFFLAHGDGLGDTDRWFKFTRWCFHNRFLQWCVKVLPPTWGQWVGLTWSASNRKKHNKEENDYNVHRDDEQEPLVQFAKQHSEQHHVDYYLFGHRHILLHLMLASGSEVCIVGDFFKEFSYVIYDESGLHIEFLE